MLGQAGAQQVDDHVFLVGRPPIEEYLGFVVSQSVGGQNANHGMLADEWRSANDHIRELEKNEAGIANNIETSSLDERLNRLTADVTADPVFQKCFQLVPTDIALVELDRLVVFQKAINLRYVDELQKGLGKNPSAESVFRFCLPHDHQIPPVKAMQIAQNAYAFLSPSMDFRAIGQAVLSKDQIVGYQPGGVMVGTVAISVGYGPNYFSAIHVDGRLVLNNGSHRAYALRDMGVTRAPCLIQTVSRRDELSAIGAGDLVANPERYLDEVRPPLLKDYFDLKLRKLVKVPTKLRQIRVSIGIEQSDVPA